MSHGDHVKIVNRFISLEIHAEYYNFKNTDRTHIGVNKIQFFAKHHDNLMTLIIFHIPIL